jgi:hypothetical protein
VKNSLFGPPPRPVGYLYRKEVQLDESRVVHYFTSDGFEYWPDIQHERILTNDPSLSLSFHEGLTHDHTHHYLLVRFDGAQVVITGPNQTPFRHNLRDRNNAGVQNWRISEILQSLEVPDCETYPWVDTGGSLPKIKIPSLEKFEDRAQQERFIFVTEILLSCVNGNWGALLSGERQEGQVIWSDALAASLRRGDLIK